MQRIHYGWNKPKTRAREIEGITAANFALLAFDFSRAFDVINLRMLRLKLLRMGGAQMYYQLSMGVSLGLESSCGGQRLVVKRAAVLGWPPPGIVLALPLYILWSADLITDLKSVPSTDIFMYADDTAMLCSGASMEQAGKRPAGVIWANWWKMHMAWEKTQAIVISQWAHGESRLSLKVSGAKVTGDLALRAWRSTYCCTSAPNAMSCAGRTVPALPICDV